MPNNVEVTWDGVKKVEIRMPESQKGRLCGICGNFDGVEDAKDMQMGKNTVAFNTCPAKAVSEKSWGQPVSYPSVLYLL